MARTVTPYTKLRRMLSRLCDANRAYAEEAFFADDNGMCDTPEAKRLDKVLNEAEALLDSTARPRAKQQSLQCHAPNDSSVATPQPRKD